MAELQEIVNILQKEFDSVLDDLLSDTSLEDKVLAEIKKMKIEVSNARAFKELSDDRILSSKNSIWVVVGFQSGSANYGAMAIPTQLSVFGFPNSVNSTQVLLTRFATTWTTKALGYGLSDIDSSFSTSMQVWSTPNVFSAFNDVGEHFRSLFSINGTIVLDSSSSAATVRVGSITYIYDEENSGSETIDFMTFSSEYRASPNTQPFGNTYGHTKTEIQFSTDTFTISTYALDTQLVADAMYLKGFTQTDTTNYKTPSFTDNDNNHDFTIIITFTNGFSNSGSDSFFQTWKCAGVSISQNLGDIMRLSITFTH